MVRGEFLHTAILYGPGNYKGFIPKLLSFGDLISFHNKGGNSGITSKKYRLGLEQLPRKICKKQNILPT